MKNNLLIFCLLFLSTGNSFAQSIGIGSASPDNSSVLDITSTTKGLLVPRNSSSVINGMINPAKGLIVYDSSASLMMINNGSKTSPDWRPVGYNSGWNLDGNSGTNPAIHFMGTKDNNPLQFRINNINAGGMDSASRKTFLGYNSGSNITTGTGNTGFGYRTLYSNTAGNSNTAAGAYSLQANTSGNNNSSIGYEALFSNSTGSSNTAIGVTALRFNTTGNNNTATGKESLYSNSTGSYNTAAGLKSLYNNENGSYNVAMGFQSLYNNTSGIENVAVGSSSLFANTTGFYNTGVGTSALSWNTGGMSNCAFGNAAMYYNTTGSYNTAAGEYSLLYNTIGNQNTATGRHASYRNVSGNYNTSMGSSALRECVDGWGNTGIGFETMINTISASYNTALGYRAGANATNGWNNTFVGAEAQAANTELFNCIAIGNVAFTTASNQVRIGNSSNNSIGGYAGWTTISDARFKRNISDNVKGLDFIMKLRPVTYNLDIGSLSKALHETESVTWNKALQQSASDREQALQTGFIAQEVEAAAKSLGYDFSGVDKPKNANDFYGLRYAEFVVPLVKGMQEQQQQISELKKQNAELAALVARQQDRIEALSAKIVWPEAAVTSKDNNQQQNKR